MNAGAWSRDTGIDDAPALHPVFVLGGERRPVSAGAGRRLFNGRRRPRDGESLLIFAFIVVVDGGLGSITGICGAALVVSPPAAVNHYYAVSGLGDSLVVLATGSGAADATGRLVRAAA